MISAKMLVCHHQGALKMDGRGHTIWNMFAHTFASLYDDTLLWRACARCFCCVRCSLHVEEEFSLDRNSGLPHWPPRATAYSADEHSKEASPDATQVSTVLCALQAKVSSKMQLLLQTKRGFVEAVPSLRRVAR